MSVERTIANYLRIAREDLVGARLLAQAANRNAAYLAEQAAEKIIRAVLTSESIHGGPGHALGQMVETIPDANPIKTRLRELTILAAYATSYRYPTPSRVPPAPDHGVLLEHLALVERALDQVAGAFGVDLAGRGDAARPQPLRTPP